MRRRCYIQLSSVISLAAALGLPTPPAPAQDGRPQPTAPDRADEAEAPADRPEPVVVDVPHTTNGRRPANGDMVVLAFDGVSVEDTLPFIVETTGKVVMPASTTAITALMQKKVTLVNDRPVGRMEALDLLFSAFRMNGVGVIETNDRVILALLSEVKDFNPPVIGADESLLPRTERGIIVTKIYRVVNTDAEGLAEQIREAIPEDATLAVDGNSNQIMLLGDIALCQHVQRLIAALDHTYINVRTETFRLAHADASEIAQNILDLFEGSETAGRGGTAARTPQSTRRLTADQRRRQREAGRTTADRTPGPTVEMRVTVNVQQNSVTISGEPAVVEQIADLINNEWDLPRPETTKKVYHLKYTDPLKMRDMLQELLGGQGGVVGGARRPRTPGTAGGGGRADVSEAIGGIYQIQAYPDSNSLVVICKTVESFEFLDSLIEDLDQPMFPGLPLVIELKHADAEEVADQVNAIFAPAGARVDIQRRESGLRGIDIEGPAGAGADTGGDAREAGEGGSITFPWQQGRQREDETPESPLIGKVRVVPIHRQNAVMILAAPEYRDAVRDIIVLQLDKPGRQVMITAIIAEVELSDDLALGIRLSNSDTILGGPLVDNRIGGRAAFSGTENDLFDNLFDTSVLDVNVSLNVLLQALAQNTKIRILQEPAVFTADNQEASFFQGQDVPILQTSQTTAEGTVNETVQYQAVGIGLNVRPRITAEGDVDMEINLEISNIDPAETAISVSNSPVFDRRETTTQVIVKDGQTIVISGILRDLESKVERKVPLLGDIPLLGELFKSRENTTSRTELLAFVTPLVVDNPDQNDANFNQRAREHLQDLSRPLKDQERRAPDPERMQRRLLDPQSAPGMTPSGNVDKLGEE
ncbi:MAG: secretin N-terminal domain-containing protein [Planctomycetota bacterium]|jgi:general secretion pathway protein D